MLTAIIALSTVAGLLGRPRVRGRPRWGQWRLLVCAVVDWARRRSGVA
nr:hypothetical protein [Kibdelosporangium sp. MJ126-NF4]CTQ94737.1 hypothetical protein [Kibdelosporangium sp. MJ126-NF4]